MTTGGLIEGRDPDEPVDTGLGSQQTVRVFADDRDCGALQAYFVARLIVDDFALEAAALGPPKVHPQEHLGPILRLGAAGPRVDGEDGVLPIVLASEHLLRFGRLDLSSERVETRRQLAEDVFALAGPLHQNGEVARAAFQRFDEVAVFLEAAASLQHLLGFGLIFPEIWRRDPPFEPAQPFDRLGGLKASSADPRSA